MATILIVEDDPENLKVYNDTVSRVEQKLGLHFKHNPAANYEEAQQVLEKALNKPEERPVLVLLDMEIPRAGHKDKRGGYKLMREYRWKFDDTYWIPLTAHVAWHEVGPTTTRSLFDDLYHLQPFDVFAKGSSGDLGTVVCRALKLVQAAQEDDLDSDRGKLMPISDTIIRFDGEEYVPPPYRVYYEIRSAAETARGILLFGEPGTGRSLTARLIHHYSERKGDFVEVGVMSSPAEFEKTLFPSQDEYDEGETRPLLDKAKGGTLYIRELDQIGGQGETGKEETERLQRKLLHYIKYKGYDVRLIGSINRSRKDIPVLTVIPEFKENMIPLDLPPLRERKDDIPALVEVFLERFNREHKEIQEAKAKEWRPRVLVDRPKIYELLQAQDWREGNIAQLRRVVEEVLLKSSVDEVTSEDFQRVLEAMMPSPSSLEPKDEGWERVGRRASKPTRVITEEDLKRLGL